MRSSRRTESIRAGLASRAQRPGHTLDREAEVVGAAALAALEQGEEIRAQPEEGAARGPADHVQPHQRLVPLDRATYVGHPDGNVIDVDRMQDGIRPGILAVRLGHLILAAHCLGKVVLSAVRIEAGPNVGRPSNGS